MSDIQQAREVLAKWRRFMSPDSWRISGSAVSDTSGTTIADYADVQNIEARRAALANAQLIVGTAGNPELLDAIDGTLERALFGIEHPSWGDAVMEHHAVRIAAAILAADKRMNA